MGYLLCVAPRPPRLTEESSIIVGPARPCRTGGQVRLCDFSFQSETLPPHEGLSSFHFYNHHGQIVVTLGFSNELLNGRRQRTLDFNGIQVPLGLQD